MALFSKRGANSGAFFLNYCTFIGNGLGRSDISNELLDYMQIEVRGQKCISGEEGRRAALTGRHDG